MSLERAKEETLLKKEDNVYRPSHYNMGGVECIDAIEAAVTGLDGFEGFCIGNAIKYLWRWKYKGGLEDLKKAEFYIYRVIDRRRNDE